MTKRTDKPRNTPSASRALVRIPVQVGLIGLLIGVAMWYAMTTSSRIARQYAPLVAAAMEIKYETAIAHLWFEEIMSGDQTVSIDDVWYEINQAEWYAKAMLHGDQNEEGTFIPLDDPELRLHITEVLEKVRAFRAIARERLAATEVSGIGSDIDQAFDEVFHSLLTQADIVETNLQRVMNRDIQRSQSVQLGLLLSCLILTGIVGVILHRFQRRQVASVARLRASNQQLTASEQQLRASNQQLTANEQQLRASNQQLTASEQQLRAANQQLTANEQQLRAANQQLTASEQQLRASNQQLTAHEQQLRSANQQLAASEQELRATNQQLSASEQQLRAHQQQLESANQHLRTTNHALGERVKELNCMYGVSHLLGSINGSLAEYMDGACGIIQESWQYPEVTCARIIIEDSVSSTPNFRETEWKQSAEIKADDKAIGQVEVYYLKKMPDSDEGPFLKEERNLINGVAGIFGKVIERRRATVAVEQSEARYRSTVDNLLVGVVVHDSDSSILLSNPKASEVLGLSAEQMAGKEAIDPAWRFVHEDSSDMKVEDYPVSKVIATKEPLREYIVGINRPDRNLVTWVNVSAFPILSSEGALEKIVVNFIDITENRRLQALESRAERLETAGTIAGQVAHDFNNLLAPIIAYPDFVRDQLPHDNKAHGYLDAIEDAAMKIANINQDLLTMGRRGHFNQETLDLNRIVLQASTEMESRVKTVKVQVELCEDLMMIKGGGAQVNRMLTNLLLNAQDAMQNVGRITVRTENYYADDTTIAFGRVPRGEYVKLSVIDNGCGIADDIIQKILDPFFSTKTTDMKRGSGLGLSVVDAVVKDHDGYLDLTSKVGHGTTFFVYFPITRDDGPKDEAEAVVGGNETVLVVDDDDIQREVSARLLTRLGYSVSVVDSGEKAVEFVREHRPDLLILDMVMPGGMDGTDTYRQIAEINPNQKAIIVSGFSESDRVLEAQRLGAGAFVRKPVTRKTIAIAIRTELSR